MSNKRAPKAWDGGRNLETHPLTAAEWNERFKPGIEVVVILDNGDHWKTKTRSEAWEIGNGTPVISLEGKAGGYALKRVAPL